MPTFSPQQQSYFLQGLGNIGNFFGNSQMADTYGDINDMYNQYYQQGQQNVNPFIQAGQQTIPQMQDFNNRLSTQATNFNPQQQLNDLQSGYTETPYAKYMTGLATTEANNQQEMSGLYGSGQGIADTTRIGNNIASADFQNYMNNFQNQQNYGLGLNNQAMNGMNNLYQGGMNSANNFNNFMAQMATGRASAMQGQGASNAAGSGGLFGAIGDLAGLFL